jgi:hypothetical protein
MDTYGQINLTTSIVGLAFILGWYLITINEKNKILVLLRYINIGILSLFTFLICLYVAYDLEREWVLILTGMIFVLSMTLLLSVHLSIKIMREERIGN